MKKLFLLFASVLVTFVFFQPVQSKGPSLPFDQPDGKPDPGLPWSGKWKVTWVSQDETRFELQWIDPPPNVSCNLIIDVYCLDGPEVDPPKKGDIYLREGNQKWKPDPAGGIDTQWVGYVSTEIYQCGAYISNVSLPGCCVECQMCYEIGQMQNGKWVKDKDLGCAPFAKDTEPIPYLPGKPVRLYAPQELKATRVCYQNQPDINTAYLERLVVKNLLTYQFITGENWIYYKDLIGRFADNSGRINCSDLDYSTDQFRAHFAYYEECPCWSGITLTDPGEMIRPDGGGQ